MKRSTFVLAGFLFFLSQNAFNQRDTIKTVSKVDYEVLKVELKKEMELSKELEREYKDAINVLEEMKDKNIELNQYIDKQREEIEKLKEELEKCKLKKKQ